jgi:hypothetical protein
MSRVFLVCELTDLEIIDGYAQCLNWEYMTPMFPLFELESAELASLMAATAVFLAICFAGRGLVSSLFKSGTSD